MRILKIVERMLYSMKKDEINVDIEYIAKNENGIYRVDLEELETAYPNIRNFVPSYVFGIDNELLLYGHQVIDLIDQIIEMGGIDTTVGILRVKGIYHLPFIVTSLIDDFNKCLV